CLTGTTSRYLAISGAGVVCPHPRLSGVVCPKPSLPGWRRSRNNPLGMEGCRLNALVPILVYEYLRTSPRKRRLGDEEMRDGRAAKDRAAQGQQPDGAVVAVAANGAANVPLRDGLEAARVRQGPGHQDQLGFALHRGAEPGEARVHRG